MRRIEKESTFATEMQHIGNLYLHKMTMAPISSKGIRRKMFQNLRESKKAERVTRPAFSIV